LHGTGTIRLTTERRRPGLRYDGRGGPVTLEGRTTASCSTSPVRRSPATLRERSGAVHPGRVHRRRCDRPGWGPWARSVPDRT